MSVVFLQVVESYIAHYGMGLVLILGNLGNTLMILLLRQRHKTVCSIYLSSAALINIVYLTFSIPIYIYTHLHNDPTSHSLVFCKLRHYFSHVFGQMARYFIVLACFDRYVITSINLHLSYFNRSIAGKRLVCFVTIFWCLIGSHQLIFTTITNEQCGQFQIYFIVNHIYLIISVAIIPPILMIIFGSLAYHQVKRLHRRIRPAGNHTKVFLVHRKDRELLVIILIEVFIYVLTMTLYLMINLEILVTFSRKEKKSVDRLDIEHFIMTLALFLIYVNHAALFYIYIFVSRRFRRDLKALFRKFHHRTAAMLGVERASTPIC